MKMDCPMDADAGNEGNGGKEKNPGNPGNPASRGDRVSAVPAGPSSALSRVDCNSVGDRSPGAGVGAVLPVVAVLFLAGAVFFGRLGTAPLFDFDEGLYASIAADMDAGGDWVTPRFNGCRYFEKPPLFHWMNAAAFRLLGRSELTARAAAAACGWLAAALALACGGSLYGRRAGLLAALCVATSFGFVIHARMAITDAPLTAFLTLALLGIAWVEGGRGRAGVPLFWVGCALALLDKGLIGVVLPLAAVAAYALATADAGVLRRLRPSLGLPLFLALTVPWHVAAARANDGFLRFFFLDNQILRFLDRAHAADVVPLSAPAFLLLVAAWLFPWCVFLPAAAGEATRGWGRPWRAAERPALLVALWALVPIGFFAASESRLGYYSLPALPALAILIGRAVDRRLAAPAQLLPALAAALALALAFAAGVAVFVVARPAWLEDVFATVDETYRNLRSGVFRGIEPRVAPPLEQVLGLAVAAASVLIAGAAASLLLMRAGRPRAAIGALAAQAVAFLLVAHLGMVTFAPYRSSAAIARTLLAQAGPGDEIVHDGSFEAASPLSFYLRRRIRVLDGAFGDLAFGSRYPEARDWFLAAPDLDRLASGPARVWLVTPSAERAGAVQERGWRGWPLPGSRWLFSNR